jgi:Tfp pilus assembly protein PilN
VIELYDSSRLTIKRDHTMVALGSTLLVVSGAMAAYTAYLQLHLRSTHERTQQLQAQLAAQDNPARNSAAPAQASNAPRAALVADLRRQAEQMEREASLARAPHSSSSGDALPTPARWMVHLGELTRPDTSLQKIDIERGGGATIEGLATSPQALNALVQNWEKDRGLAHLQPRSIDIKHEKSPAPFLRFQLRATPAPTAPSLYPAPPPATGAPAAEP